MYIKVSAFILAPLGTHLLSAHGEFEIVSESILQELELITLGIDPSLFYII